MATAVELARANPPGGVRERYTTVSPPLTALHRRIADRTAPTSTGAVCRNGR
ncbi:hypothetical protein I0C86_39715 [Plantactinospora sp. S1510]|uniref:Uncharacterized protein n=1 Tax=Plantactinospora alkalitolerans TaxID=2789879 RepID=A0ABS0HA13_9ACTN|nr:hypothetical protein [Plantactinospora alkalitolerans]MBF9135008.1 hypothetical protein [Plantactinospora alkalitolerans]